MAFQRVPNSAEIDVIYTLNGEIVQNTFYAQFGGVYGQSNLQTLADDVGAEVGLVWLPLQPLEASLIRTEVRGLNAENDFIAISTDGAGPGEDLVEALPNNVTLSVKKSSVFTGRSARGRIYWIGIPRDKVQGTNENRIKDTYLAAVIAAVEAIRVVIDGSFNWDPVIVSRFTGGAKRTEGVTFPWIASSTVDDIVDTQRGRLPS